MTESEKFLDKIMSLVDSDDKHFFRCHKADIKAYAKIYHKEQLNSVISKVRELENESNKLKGYIEALEKKLTITDVVKRYDANKYTPPFRVGRKQGKAVLDGKGLEVVFFMHSEEQAKMYCDYLNNVC